MQSVESKTALAHATGVDPEWLIYGDESKAPANLLNVSLYESAIIPTNDQPIDHATIKDFLDAFSKIIPSLPDDALDLLREKVIAEPTIYAPILGQLFDEYDKRFRRRQ